MRKLDHQIQYLSKKPSFDHLEELTPIKDWLFPNGIEFLKIGLY